MPPSLYVIALGSNQRHMRFSGPRRVLFAALNAMQDERITIRKSSRPVTSRPVGPSRRSYANGAALIETTMRPDELLRKLKQIERHFGQRRGQRWSKRTLDLDIILWEKGSYSSGVDDLVIPHPHFRERDFVLGPIAMIAADWRDPISGLSIAQLASRLNQPKPLDRKALRP